MTNKLFLTGIIGLASISAAAQLNSSVSVEGEYEPLVIETERLNSFPLGYRFDLPASSLSYEYEGIVTDFRPDLLTMGVTGRKTVWPWTRRRGYADLRLGSYLNSNADAGFYILDSKDNTLFANLRFRSDSYKERVTESESKQKTLYNGSLSLQYRGNPASGQSVHAEASGQYLAYAFGKRAWRLSAIAGYDYRFAECHSVGVDADGDFMFPHRIYSGFGVVSFNPFYRYSKGMVEAKAGADLAFSYDAMGSSAGRKLGIFHIAPDVNLQLRPSSGIGLSLSATGGVNPYSSTLLFSPQPVYTPVDARFGISAGPFAGFTASALIRYAVACNVPVEAWETAYPGDESRAAKLHGYSLGLDLQYSLGTMLNFCFNGSYTPQEGKEGIFNGYDRPRWTLKASAAVRPIKKLGIELCYDYRGVRNCYAWTSTGPIETLGAVRLPDITELNAKLSYNILENLEIYVKGENLLNRRINLLPEMKSVGLCVLGGLYFEF